MTLLDLVWGSYITTHSFALNDCRGELSFKHSTPGDWRKYLNYV